MPPHAALALAGQRVGDHLHDPGAARPVGLDVLRGLLPLCGSLRLGPAAPRRCRARGASRGRLPRVGCDAFPGTGCRSGGRGSSGCSTPSEKPSARRSGARRPPGRGTSEKRLRRVERVRLDQHAFQVKAAQQILESSPLAGFVSVVGLLGHGDAKGPGIDRHLGHKTVAALLRLNGRAAQGLAVTHQLVQTIGPAWDLADHPGLQHLPKFLQVGLVEEVEKGGIRGPALELQAERLIQRLTVPPGERLEIPGTAAATQDPEHGYQQQEPLRVTNPTAVSPVRDGLEEADQVIRCGLIYCSKTGFWHWGH